MSVPKESIVIENVASFRPAARSQICRGTSSLLIGMQDPISLYLFFCPRSYL